MMSVGDGLISTLPFGSQIEAWLTSLRPYCFAILTRSSVLLARQAAPAAFNSSDWATLQEIGQEVMPESQQSCVSTVHTPDSLQLCLLDWAVNLSRRQSTPCRNGLSTLQKAYFILQDMGAYSPCNGSLPHVNARSSSAATTP